MSYDWESSQNVSFAVCGNSKSGLIVNVALKRLYIHEEGVGNKMKGETNA